MSDQPASLSAQLAQIRDLTRQVLPSVAADRALTRALRHAQSAVEVRLGLPSEAPKGNRRK